MFDNRQHDTFSLSHFFRDVCRMCDRVTEEVLSPYCPPFAGTAQQDQPSKKPKCIR